MCGRSAHRITIDLARASESVRMSPTCRAVFVALSVFGLTRPVTAYAQVSTPSFLLSETARHGEETIAELTDRGEHLKAVSKAVDRSDALTLDEKIHAGKSAWALGLPDRARMWWDEALAVKEFTGTERYRTLLARSIVALQEKQFDEARRIAERTANELEPSDLRAQLWLVVAEALKEQNALSLAEGYYRKALDDGGSTTKSEAQFLLGECLLSLGRVNDARHAFTAVSSESSEAPRALRRLAELDLSQRNFDGVLTWLEEGRESHADRFQDGWTSYALISAFTEIGRLDRARKELDQLKVRHGDGDEWFPLADAAVEAASARARLLSPETKNGEAEGR